jgi:hypothetical protein
MLCTASMSTNKLISTSSEIATTTTAGPEIKKSFRVWLVLKKRG